MNIAGNERVHICIPYRNFCILSSLESSGKSITSRMVLSQYIICKIPNFHQKIITVKQVRKHGDETVLKASFPIAQNTTKNSPNTQFCQSKILHERSTIVALALENESSVSYTVNSKISRGLIFAKLRMKIKPSRNGEIALSFADIGK